MKRKPRKSMFEITGSILALPDILEALGEAIYTTHLALAQTKTDPIIPPWHYVSEDLAEYVLARARAAAAVVDAYRAGCRRKRPPRDPGPVTGNKPLLEDIAQAIYRTHGRNLPTWKSVTEDIRQWNRQYALAVSRIIDDCIAQHGKG
jgi:hypothetical protein